MRKAILSIVTVFMLVTTVAKGQMTNNEIMKTIIMSKELNKAVGVNDPNLIYIGQQLTFRFSDGTEKSIFVEKGDNQWTIVQNKLPLIEAVHGKVVDYDSVPQPPQSTIVQPVTPMDPFEIQWWETFPWGWALAGFCFIILAIKLLEMLYNSRNQNPITAGAPQVPGGVTDQRAHQRMSDLVAQRYPGSRIEVKNIRRGRLSGSGKVFYAEGKSKKINLKNIAAYAGEILVNGDEQTVYFLQGCGNDVRVGNYMFGTEFIFTPDVIINQDGSESPIPLPTEVAEVVETEKIMEEQLPTSLPVNLGSETHQQRMKILEIVGIETAKGNVHEVTIDSAPDAFGVTMKYKFGPQQKRVAEKKEEKK